MIETLQKLIVDHEGGVPVDARLVGDSLGFKAVLYAADQSGVILADERSLGSRRAVPWQSVAAIGWAN